ncbi:MAG: hypothetical protein ACE5EO_12975, partial [Candidatus Krumholzibacteriia bacterium]
MRSLRLCLGVLWALVAGAGTADVAFSQCTILFDATCPNAAPECGASFTGGGGCLIAGLPNCYDSGLVSYQVTSALPVTVTLTPAIDAITVFFAHSGTATGTMRFFDAITGGNEVGALINTNGNCAVFMPARQTRNFATPVFRIEATATGIGA